MVLTGAGISAESGLPTFRDADGLWRGRHPHEVATPSAWVLEPELVLDFYNMRRDLVRQAKPNAAHEALVKLEQHFDVYIITQNVDDLHERAGSSNILHLHGQILRGRSEYDPSVIVELGDRNIHLGDKAPDGGRLRPDIVWFGEEVPAFDEAEHILKGASRLLVVGTSLTVYPAARLVYLVEPECEVTVVSKWIDGPTDRFRFIENDATVAVPDLVAAWTAQSRL